MGLDLRTSLTIVLRRARSDLTVLGATAVTVLLATTLLAASPMYADAVATSGLRGTLAAGAPADVGARVVARVSAERAADVADELAALGSRRLSPWLLETSRVVVSGAVRLEGLPADHIVTLAAAPALREHVELVAGAWPASTGGTPEPEALLHADAAELAGLQPGDVAEVEVRGGASVRIPIAGTYRPEDPSAAHWWGEPSFRDGVVPGSSFTTVGPLVVGEDDLTVLGGGARVTVETRHQLDPEAVSAGDVTPLRVALVGLGRDLAGTDAAERPVLESGLNALLAATDRAVTVTRAAVILTAMQLAVLAVYALVLAAGLLRATRVVEAALVRARGAEPSQLVRLAAVEGTLLVLPAVLVAPFLAAAGLRGFSRIGVLGELGLGLAPEVSGAAFVAAAGAGVVCLLALVTPALRDATPFAAARAATGREDRQPFAQRAGLDLALVAVAALGIWQLTRYRSPLAEDLQGRLGIDPILVAAPALGLLAGAVLTLRLVPALARVAERAVARRSALVPALGAWQLGRRPTRTARSVLLLLLAVAIGTFASTYSGTWLRSQQDQADALVAADLRVAPDRRPGALDPLSLAGAYRAVDGVTHATPALETRASLVGGRGQPRLLAVDAADAGALRVRADLPTAGPAGMLADLRSRRPAVPGVPLGTGERVTLTATATADVALPGPLRVRLLLQDGTGGVHRAFAGQLPPSGVAVPLEVVVRDDRSAAPPTDLRLVALEVVVPVPGEATAAPAGEGPPSVPVQVTIADVAVDGRPARLDTVPWRSGTSTIAEARTDPEVRRLEVRGSAVVLDLSSGSTIGERTTTTLVTVRPDEAVRPAVLPAYVTPGLLATTASAVGDTLRLQVEGQEEQLEIAGTVTALPGAPDASDGVVVDLVSLAANRAIRGEPTVPTTWLLATDVTEPTTATVAGVLAAPPFASADVVSRHAVGRGLREDPVALGLIGALGLGFLAAAGFAAAGYGVTSVVSARERLSEFALLSALGTTARHIRRWLLLESGAVVLVSLGGGIVLGLGLARVVLPAISLSRSGTAVVPAPLLVVPWSTLAAITVAGVLVLVAVPLLLSRAVSRVRVAETLRAGDEA